MLAFRIQGGPSQQQFHLLPSSDESAVDEDVEVAMSLSRHLDAAHEVITIPRDNDPF